MGKKKEKVTYIDDGRSLADMSGVSGPRLTRNPMKPAPRFKEAWATYWNAVKMMFLPMLAVIGALVLIYGVMYLLFSLAA
ncbi:MAG: hypothetical protein E7455_08515 [Ruminococcaceae bacterium]|nr:hypothetical protein [Oscillospiraceae bacterium]